MKRSRTCFFDTNINDVDVELEIEYNFYGGCRGARGAYGEPLEPDDAPEIEILKAINLETKEDMLENLSTYDIEKIEEKIFNIESEPPDYDHH